MKMKRKEYTTPAAEEVELRINTVIADPSIPVGGDDERTSDSAENPILGKEQSGGSWNDIWGGLQ